MSRRDHRPGRLERNPSTGEAMIRFGDWLVRRGLISCQDKIGALTVAAERRCRVGDALVLLKLLDRARVEQEARIHHAFTAFLKPSHLATVLLGD